MMFSELIKQDPFYSYSLVAWIFMAPITLFVLLRFKPKTYGRNRNVKLISINNTLGWFLMEIPAVFLMPYFMLSGSLVSNNVVLFFLLLYIIHYINRSVIFPFRLKTKGKKIPIQIVCSALLFNLLNTYFIGHYFGSLQKEYSSQCGCYD